MAIRRAFRLWVATFRSINRLLGNYFGTEKPEDLHVLDKRRIPPQNARTVIPARPQLVSFFSILLFRHKDQHPRRAFFDHIGKPSSGTTGGNLWEDGPSANLNGAETVGGGLRREQGEGSRDFSP